MHTTKIGIFKLAQTRVNWQEVADWLEFIGVQDVTGVLRQLAVGSLEQDAVAGGDCLPWDAKVATDASALIALAAKRCYNSFEVGLNPNVSQIRTDHAEYITNVLKSAHGSVMEHASWTFALENVSRVFTGEMNRHRAGTAISEGSMRYIRFDDIGFWTPSSITHENKLLNDLLVSNDLEGMSASDVWEAKSATRQIFENAFKTMESWQLDLSRVWKIDEIKSFHAKKVLTSMFRRLIGMGISTGGVWTMNARALRFILEKRGDTAAEEEIYYVFDQIATRMVADEPLLFGDFTQNDKGAWVPKYSKV